MNKAFVREPDDTGAGHCPRCGSLGIAVGADTLRAQLDADTLHQLADVAFFCPFPKCDVAYFDHFERTVAADRLRRLTYPKDPHGPLCSCFDFTTADVEQDLAEGVTVRTKALLAKTQSPEAHCTTLAPDGRCCRAEVQRYFMRARGGTE